MRFCLNVLANCHFRFEYPPAPTPKKKASAGGKTETFKVIYLLYLSSPEHCGHQRLELACISAKCGFFNKWANESTLCPDSSRSASGGHGHH